MAGVRRRERPTMSDARQWDVSELRARRNSGHDGLAERACCNIRGREGVSAENRNPSSQTDDAPDPPNNAPESKRGGVVASHGENEKRAYVAPIEVPKRMQRHGTFDMSKVRIAPDMKAQNLDPRHMPTRKMDIPPGGIRPVPPPASTEVADAQVQPQPKVQPGASASPWSQSAGIDRSMLPSAGMAPAAPSQAARAPSVPPTGGPSRTNYGPAIWIAVIVLAALIGGGIAFALRSGASGGATDTVSSSAPIAITVPGATVATTSTESPANTEEIEELAATEDAGAATPSTKSPNPRTVLPQRPSTTTKPTATETAPAPTTTSTARPRLFN